MVKKLLYLWEEISASFWFVPIIILLLAITAAFGLIYLDSRVEIRPDGFAIYLFSGSEDSARRILTTIAAANIGIAGTVFSITLVVLTLASSQLGSRLLRNFMYDKINQVVLGTYVSTFVYCLLILNSIVHNDGNSFIPVISVFVAILAAIAGIILLIIFIHHVSVTIQANRVVSEISNSILKNAEKLFPDEIGDEPDEPFPGQNFLKKSFKFIKEIKCSKNGYLQSVDGGGLINIARENEGIIILYYRPGNFMVKDLVISEVLGNKECSDEIAGKINDSFIIGKLRTPLQDVEFSIDQIAEIASRALSPGINDPYTAIACIDNLTSVMCRLATRKFPHPNRYDREGRLRVIASSLTFGGMLNAAFNQIRHDAERNPSVIKKLMESMIVINHFVKNGDRKKEILEHANMIMGSAERNFQEKRDLDYLKQKFNSLNSES